MILAANNCSTMFHQHSFSQEIESNKESFNYVYYLARWQKHDEPLPIEHVFFSIDSPKINVMSYLSIYNASKNGRYNNDTFYPDLYLITSKSVISRKSQYQLISFISMEAK